MLHTCNNPKKERKIPQAKFFVYANFMFYIKTKMLLISFMMQGQSYLSPILQQSFIAPT